MKKLIVFGLLTMMLMSMAVSAFADFPAATQEKIHECDWMNKRSEEIIILTIRVFKASELSDTKDKDHIKMNPLFDEKSNGDEFAYVARNGRTVVNFGIERFDLFAMYYDEKANTLIIVNCLLIINTDSSLQTIANQLTLKNGKYFENEMKSYMTRDELGPHMLYTINQYRNIKGKSYYDQLFQAVVQKKQPTFFTEMKF